MLKSYVVAVLAVIIASVGQIVLKIGLDKTNATVTFNFKSLLKFALDVANPTVLIGLFMYFFSAFLWLIVLSELEVSRAYPILGLSYFFILVLAVIFLGESLSVLKVIGTALIFTGVILVSVR